jgi:hypothetical protein
VIPTIADCKAQGAFIQSESAAANFAANNPGRRLLAGRDNDEELKAIRVGGVEGAAAYARIALAELDEQIASAEEGSDHHRSLLERRSLASKAGKMMQEAYNRCDYNGNNGQACGYSDGCMFAFRGSNAPFSWDGLQDWWANIFEAFSSSSKYGPTMHGGFVGEFDKIKGGSGGIVSAIAGCGSSATFVGHSLGGAIAVVAREYAGTGTVYTFGAPAVYKNEESCSYNGYRMMHEGDPVTLLAGVAGYDHGRTKTTYEIDNYCVQHNQFCIPYPCGCGWRGCSTCHSCINTTCKRHANRLRSVGCRATPSTCIIGCITSVATHGAQGYYDMSV